MAKYIVQKAVNPDKVKKKLQRSMEEYAATRIVQDKLDGCNAVMILPCFAKDGEARVLSRTGEDVPSMASLARTHRYRFRREVQQYGGIVLLGEAFQNGIPQNVISGLFRQHGDAPELDIWVFDVLTMAEFEAGHSPVPYRERYNRLTSEGAGETLIASWEPGTYTVADKLAEAMALGGRDGIILRDPEGTWTAGSGTTGEIVKIKRTLSFDLEVAAVEGGKGKHAGRAGALVVKFGGKELRVGTGFSDHERQLWADAPKIIIGKIVEVEAMDYSSEGLLREPRFKGIRYDKLEPDTIAA